MIHSIFTDVEQALRNQESFLIGDRNVQTIKKTEIVSRIIHHFSGHDLLWFKKNAVWLTESLKSKHEFEPGKVAAAVKSFLRQYQNYHACEEFKNCSLELLASKLNIDSRCLDEKINPGFIAFAKKNYLYNSLETYNHQLLVDETTFEIKIKYRNEYIPWGHAKRIIDGFLQENEQKNKLNEPCSPCLYGRKGIQNKDRYNWENLKSFLKGDVANWADHFIKDPLIFDDNNEGYIMEFCSSATEKAPRILAGDHTWIRLYQFKKTDEKIIGKMHSIGLYRPSKHHFFIDNFWMPFRIKQGYITQDISEEWGINTQIRTVAKRITATTYQKIMTKVANDKKINRTIFHLFQHNCDEYVVKLAELDLLELPTKRHFLKLFTCIHLEKSFFNQLNEWSKPVRMAVAVILGIFCVFGYLMTPFLNLIFYLIGSGRVDTSIQDPTARPVLSSFADLFNMEKLYVYSPWVLGHIVKDDVEHWRQEEIKKLGNSKEEQEKKNEILFDFPPHLYRT